MIRFFFLYDEDCLVDLVFRYIVGFCGEGRRIFGGIGDILGIEGFGLFGYWFDFFF